MYLRFVFLALCFPIAVWADTMPSSTASSQPEDNENNQITGYENISRDDLRTHLLDILTEDREVLASVIEEILHERPEIIVESLTRYQTSQQELHSRQFLDTYGDIIFNNSGSPVIGNPDGDVTIVEFFDYNCGFCKQMMDALLDVVETDGNIRLVLKEFPILTESSEYAAIAALAADEQGRYEDMHRALMKSRSLSDGAIKSIARNIGLDLEAWQKSMQDNGRIAEEIQMNQALAQGLGIDGTPAMIIGTQSVFGYAERDEIEAYVLKARLYEQE